MFLKTVRSKKQQAVSLLKHIQSHPPTCPCHSCTTKIAGVALQQAAGSLLSQRAFGAAKNAVEPDYAFEMSFSSIRYGLGVTKEVGFDFKHLGIEKVAVFTDKNLLNKISVKNAIEALESQGIKYEIYSDVLVEPKDHGIRHAIEWARNAKPDGYLAVGGGSVMDTAKIANLFQTYPEADLMDFVNAPVGKGLPVERKVKPLIAVPTTAGTGSETTGTAIFDLTSQKSKTGIASRAIKPILGLVDPLNTRTMPASVKASSGLDVLCHALESYTTIPYNQRTPRPADPILRPAYQGANPISDIFCTAALKLIVEYLPRSVKDPNDFVAQEQTVLAATLAGICLNNSGVHLAHGLSYPLSSQNKGYKHYGYEVDHPIIPHGVSVAVTAPAVFKFTAASNPERHLEAARIFGVDTSNVKLESAGEVLSEAIKDFLYNKLGDQPHGISDLGFTEADLPALVKGALPQRRVLNLAPALHNVDDGIVSEYLHEILSDSLKF